jgi:hypothetical protein
MMMVRTAAVMVVRIMMTQLLTAGAVTTVRFMIVVLYWIPTSCYAATVLFTPAALQ